MRIESGSSSFCRSIDGSIFTYLAGNQVDVAVEVARLAIAPGNAARIPVADIKRGSSPYRRSKVDSISFVRPIPVPGTDPMLPDIGLDLVTLSWAEGLLRKIFGANQHTRGADPFTRPPPTVFNAGDPGWEPLVRSIMFSTPLHRPPQGDPLADPDTEFDEQCDPGLRAFVTLMARSQLPLGRALVGMGRGKGILKVASARLEETMKARCKGIPAILSEEEVLHFCFAERDRLGLDKIVPPLVLIR